MSEHRGPDDVEIQMFLLREYAHDAATAHLEACYDHILTGAPAPEGMEEPFDGCVDCQVRETLRAAWPHMRELAILEDDEQFGL